MKHILLIVATFVIATPVFAQISQERQILVTPRAEHPQIAKDSGLGGRVTVYVTVDNAGNVVSVGDATGPDNVCPSVTRADVVALRESAKAAAANAKFAAGSGEPSVSIPLNFDFPTGGKTDGKLPVMGDKEYNASNSSPGDSVSGADGGAKVPKEISGGVLNGKATNLPKPPYPPAARAVQASGAVNIQVLIDHDGKVFSASAVSGHPLLRAASRQAACGSEFSPTTLMGNPVRINGIITYNFVP
jgi:outer membrane biosynthesis protein TonB